MWTAKMRLSKRVLFMQKILAEKYPWRSRQYGRFIFLRSLVVIAFAVVGGLMLVNSHAATFATSAEAESGTVSGNASIISDGNASGAHAVKFGSATVSTGTTFGMALGGSYQSLSAADLNRRFADMEAMGVQWVRFDISWADIQSSGSSSYIWAPYDAVVHAARQHNLNILAMMGYAPQWAQQTSCAGQFACPPNGTSSFATFAAAAAKHYESLGVSYWEIWNEPNITNFWLTPNAAAYTGLLKAAYTAIKQANPSATVISAGLSDAATDGTNIAPYDFAQDMYTAGVHGYFDAFGDHPYCYSDPNYCPATTGVGNGWSVMALTSQNIRALMVANGDGGKKIWMTEFGAPTGGDPTSQVTEAQQAKMMQEAYALAASYSWAGPLFWYSYQDAGTDNTTVEDWFGVVRADGSDKPAYTTYKQLTGK